MTESRSASVRRYAHIEVSDPPEPNAILHPIPSYYRWGCDYCRMHRRCSTGRWTDSETTAQDQADQHDDMHDRERQYKLAQEAR